MANKKNRLLHRFLHKINFQNTSRYFLSKTADFSPEQKLSITKHLLYN